MGAACGCHCWEKHYDSIYVVKKRQIKRPDGATEIYVESEHKRNQGSLEVEGSMHLPVEAFVG